MHHQRYFIMRNSMCGHLVVFFSRCLKGNCRLNLKVGPSIRKGLHLALQNQLIGINLVKFYQIYLKRYSNSILKNDYLLSKSSHIVSILIKLYIEVRTIQLRRIKNKRKISLNHQNLKTDKIKPINRMLTLKIALKKQTITT